MIRSKDDHEKITIKTNSGIRTVTLNTTAMIGAAEITSNNKWHIAKPAYELSSLSSAVYTASSRDEAGEFSGMKAKGRRAKISEKPTLEEIQKKGVVLGPSFDWMYEGEDKDYDELYGDYI